MKTKTEIDKIFEILERYDLGVSMLAGFGGLRADPFKILIATVLSVRAKDAATIRVVEKMFSIYDTPKKILEAPIEILEDLIRPIGFFRIKTQRIKELSKQLIEIHDSKVPSDEDNLLSLTGVGRKVANCVLVYSFDKDAIPVDIHVHRISNRIGVINTKTPEESESELMRILPKRYWKIINEKMVLLGQQVCKPISPKCSLCNLNLVCDKNLTST
ncbi:hypothetical protein BVX95_01605 [archaeon D22]|nr:hypothetical protein BVX95_01605 [archaeon D22]